MPSSLKRRLAIGVTAIAVVAFAGGAYAQSQDSGANARQAFLNDVAKRLNVTPKQLSAALQGAAIDQLNAAVASGRLTQAQANALKQRITKGATVPLPAGPGLGRPGFIPGRRLFGAPGQPGGPGFFPGRRLFGAPGQPGGPGFFPGRRLFGAPGQPGGPGFIPGRRLFGAPGQPGAPPGARPHSGGSATGKLAAAASYLGISERQLVAQLGAGKSLAQIAKARGKSLSGLKDAITASIKATLDKAVAAKMITSAQEQQILSHLSSRLGDELNRTGARFGFRVWGKGQPWRPANASASGPAAWTPVPQAGPIE